MGALSSSLAGSKKDEGVIVQMYDSGIRNSSSHEPLSETQCVFVQPATGEQHPIRLNVPSHIQALHQLQELNAPENVLKGREEMLRRSCKGIPKGVINFLSKARTHLVLLLNTHGGAAAHKEDVVENAAKFAESSGGSLHAFGTTEVASAGFDLFLLAEKQNRFALQSTDFMHHLGSLKCEMQPGEAQSFSKMLQSTYRRTMNQFLQEASSNAQPGLRRKFAKAQKESDDWEICFTGSKLKKAGILPTACANVAALVRTFIRTTNILPNYANRKTDPIARYFYFSALEEVIRRDCGNSVRIHGYPMTIHWEGDVSKEQKRKNIASISSEVRSAVLHALEEVNEKESLKALIRVHYT